MIHFCKMARRKFVISSQAELDILGTIKRGLRIDLSLKTGGQTNSNLALRTGHDLDGLPRLGQYLPPNRTDLIGATKKKDKCFLALIL